MNKAIFLDRDGVINKTIFKMGKPRAPYTLEEFSFIDGVKEAVQSFKDNGFIIIVVTNQPDVARGWVSMEQVELVNNLVKDKLAVDEIKACFHTEKDQCNCRKPKPGMLLEAAESWDIDLEKSFMVGDRLSDVEAGHAAGCKSILVGGEEKPSSVIVPEFYCADLLTASKWILSI